MRRAAGVALLAAATWIGWGRITRWRHRRALRASPEPWPPLDPT